jgi:hypothetical protein
VIEFDQWQYNLAADNSTLENEQLLIYTINVPLVGILHSRKSAGSGFELLALLYGIGYDRTCQDSMLSVTKPVLVLCLLWHVQLKHR